MRSRTAMETSTSLLTKSSRSLGDGHRYTPGRPSSLSTSPHPTGRPTAAVRCGRTFPSWQCEFDSRHPLQCEAQVSDTAAEPGLLAVDLRWAARAPGVTQSGAARPVWPCAPPLRLALVSKTRTDMIAAVFRR